MLLVFGSIHVDLVFPLPHLPRPGEIVGSDAARIEPGGKGANQAVAAARDGARVVLAGAVGQDALADVALAGPRQAGVDLQHIVRLPASTGQSAILIDPAGYTMVATDAGANRLACADQVGDALLGPDTTLLLQMETEPEQNAALIARARRRKSRIILHLSPRRAIASAALRAVDLLVGSSPELAWVGEHLGTGNNPASLHAALGVAAVRMMGTQGAEAMSDEGFLHMPAVPVDMRDSTGAGDCFIGVLAAALARGATLRQALRRAAVAAALSTTGLGAQASIPARSDIDAALHRAAEPSDTQPELPD
jgi:ribokinase